MNTKKTSFIFSLFIIGVLYFILGFVTWLNGTLIPFLKTACQLSDFLAYFVTFAFYISYFVMALPSSVILEKIGLKKGISFGLLIMSVGSALFIPAAYTRSYIFFLVGLFTLGTGMSLMQTAVNPLVTVLGPIESAARRISIMGICNKFAGILAPIILASLLFKGIDTLNFQIEQCSSEQEVNVLLDQLALRLINPYLVMTVVLVFLAIMMAFVPLPNLSIEKKSLTEESTSIFHFPHLWFGVIALFCYVGVEVIAADTIIRYGESLGVSLESAKYFTSLTLVAMVLGYFVGILLIPRFVSQRTALLICALSGILFTCGALLSDPDLAFRFPFVDLITFEPLQLTIPYTVFFVALLGLSNALVWPSIWPLALDGLGSHTERGSAFLVMAIAGGAVIPLLYGKIADMSSTQSAYWIALVCYAVVLLFALWGCKIRKIS